MANRLKWQQWQSDYLEDHFNDGLANLSKHLGISTTTLGPKVRKLKEQESYKKKMANKPAAVYSNRSLLLI